MRDRLLLQVAEAAKHLAATMTTAHAEYWSLPTERLLAMMNADVSATIETLTLNTVLAGAVNQSLDALNLDQYAHRAPTTMGRSDIIFDGTEFAQTTP
jgi:hypothetical protein